MNLKEYYKRKVYQYGYEMACQDLEFSKDHKEPTDNIYYKDEMDYYICADYYGSYVGGLEDWTEEDKKFLTGLGFEPEDFEND